MPETRADGSASERTAVFRSRTIHDEEGRAWLVREAPLPAFEPRSGLCLVFERPEVVRRIRIFPEHWLQLTDAEVYLLSEGI